MGTAPPSKPLAEPARPFKRQQKRACLQHTFVPKTRKGPTVLLQLIARREWQKVLIRVTLFPSEVTQRQKMSWYGVQWSLLPLHLACALQPPSEVISMLLRFHSDTARIRMNRCSPPSEKKRHWLPGKKKNKITATEQNDYALYRSNQRVPKNDTAPSSSDGEDENSAMPLNTTVETDEKKNFRDTERGSLLEDEAFALETDNSRIFHVFETNEDMTYSERSVVTMPPNMLPNVKEAPAPGEEHVDTESIKNSSLNEFLGKRGLALQLGPNGSLEPISVASLESKPISVASLESKPYASKMHWNLDPLLLEADALLPLHIACLYRASPTVITYLLQAYPKAARETNLGMLPIHMVCAGFELPAPVLAPPPGPVPFPMDDEYDMVESLKRLEKAFPESLDYPSHNNDMTPKMYIDETMDEGSYKNSCLEIVSKDESVEEVAEDRISEHDDTTLSDTRVPDEVHLGDDNSTIPSLQTETSSRYLGQNLPQINGFSGSRLYTQMVVKDWENALATIEERPKEGRKWQYGIEIDLIESLDSTVMWKRLPIHSACVLHAPIGFIEALILAYPKGIRAKDPFTGALPLHLACRHSAPPELVKTVITVYPVGTRVDDAIGRLPLHMACLSGALRLTIIYLLKAYPHAVLIKDDRRRTPLQYAKQNPTLKPETIQLLELVHHLLVKQPSIEGDYIFEGFASPRRMSHSSDDMSAVSGFYEDSSFAVSRHEPTLNEELEFDFSFRSQSTQKMSNVNMLAEEISQILEEDGSIGEAEVTVAQEDTVDSLAEFGEPTPENRDEKTLPEESLWILKEDVLTEQVEATVIEAAEASTEEDGEVDKLTEFRVSSTKNEDEKTLAGSVNCLDGKKHASNEANGQSSNAERASTNEDESKRPEGKGLDILEEDDRTRLKAEGAGFQDRATDLSLPVHNDSGAVKNEEDVDVTDIVAQVQPNAADDMVVCNEQEFQSDTGEFVRDHQEPTTKDEEPTKAIDPADEAAGCSHDDLKSQEKKADGLSTGEPVPESERSQGDAVSGEPVVINGETTDDIPTGGVIAYQPLIKEADDSSACDKNDSEELATSHHPYCKDETQDASTSLSESLATEYQVSINEAVATSTSIRDENEATLKAEAPEHEDNLSPPGNDSVVDELDDPPSEDSIEFQYDSKSDLSQNGESIDIDSLNTSISSKQDEPVFQERDDQLCTNSPKQEDRWDVSPKQDESLDIYCCGKSTRKTSRRNYA